MLVAEKLEKPTAEELLRHLVKSLAEDLVETTSEMSRKPEVVATAIIDGVRFSLIRSPAARPNGQFQLSPREREVIRLVAKGLPNKAIAGVLGISVWTVSTYLRRVFTKLDVCSRAEMVAFVLRSGLLHQE